MALTHKLTLLTIQLGAFTTFEQQTVNRFVALKKFKRPSSLLLKSFDRKEEAFAVFNNCAVQTKSL
ncbi:hypothetical protein [Spirosoma foliorum]|uniref:Uncharacterized protein n=1 Tax=Spirosoma foliorum TaxID=2710596 RepID=A0A7G5H092_9BACT|nr:hypothetical protein [Spirosoma foliorum]QMW04534.1 hypothetical protein H3H32_06225 [Spirosoma foliorum]